MATAAELKAEKARRAKLPAAISRLKAGLTPPQIRVLQSKSKRKLLHAGRRGGKTTTLVCLSLCKAFDFPGEKVLVLEKTLTTQASRDFWTELKNVDERFGLACTFHDTLKVCTLSNGATIEMMGSDTEDAADKVRGTRYSMVIIDEAGTFRVSVFRYLLDQAVEPALVDLEGDLIIAGTPNRRKQGPFYEFSQGAAGFEAFNWTLLDNTALPIVPVGNDNSEAERLEWRKAVLEKFKREKPHAVFVREYLGVWCEDVGGGAYGINETINVVEDFPIERSDKWTFFVGADLGFNDPCALVVWGRRKDDHHLYVVRSESRGHLPPSTWAAWAESWIENYKQLGAIGGKVADTGGAGKGYVEEAKKQFNLHFEAANKQGKLTHIDFVNGDLKTGRIRIFKHACAGLIEDLIELPMNEDGDDVADGYDDHEPDAFLYSHPLAARWQFRGFARIDEKPKKGSKEYWRRQEQAMIEQVEDEYKRKKSGPVQW